MTISKNQTAAAADLIRTIRPAWDAPMTAQIIAEMSESVPFEKVMAAAIRAATNPENKSPLSIKWQEIPAENGHPAGKYADEPRCAICKLRQTRCRAMAAKTGDPHEFVTTEPEPGNDPAVTPADWVEMIKDLVKRP